MSENKHTVRQGSEPGSFVCTKCGSVMDAEEAQRGTCTVEARPQRLTEFHIPKSEVDG